MKTISFTESRNNYAAVMDSVIDDREPVVITRTGRDPVVMIALDDYNSLQETAYLMRSPENSKRLRESIAELEAGGGVVHELLDEEA
ncbi:type II toxin-antitoxin system Phd/YefM family antitoxin [Corynebacterium cystitidis]|uniref:Antitoxin n=1 Tax=Corynebacterium cystitidis DSM 20524 TaxID=1121357 RepID=A0A1H9TCH0_9CORY|nr:type II toxin-antitoxin system prevent-host-death family antitoxin [Corynebacterium cystitidis]WJY83555.1 Antitoxin YefM [Corynebacterium cystitidis DSM 20524]SER94808.1 antitoxin YefM [Corynebacterium cystitidis DSM 20524]SNV92110.1 Antitoxin YefM [Corynebacterium cystitidis]